MTINLQTGGYVAPQILPGARSADTQFVKKQEQASVPTPGETKAETPIPAEQQRYEKVFQAAQGAFKDVFVVSDKNFSIFKDSSGQYITRYTSLRDGRVTYIPEPRLLQIFESNQRTAAKVVEIQA
jgi:hypothetical protein